MRNNPSGAYVPNYLGDRYYVDFRDDGLYDTQLDKLLREIHVLPRQQR